MKWVKLFAGNILVLLLLAVVSEFGLRAFFTISSCVKRTCDFSYISRVRLQPARDIGPPKNLGITRFDPDVGYVPQEGFDALMVEEKYEPNARITVTKDGFRLNNPGSQLPPAKILVVGGSFAWGGQVTNEHTWPACLERKLGLAVDNAGMFGYSSGQALKRAVTLNEKRNYETIVLSWTRSGGFRRDRFEYRSGFPRPAVIRTKDGIGWAQVSDPNRPGTKYNPTGEMKGLKSLYQHSLLAMKALDLADRNFDFYGGDLTTTHGSAASTEEILEWVLTQFSQMRVKNKVVLLQYSRDEVSDKQTLKERQLILEAAKRLSLTVVDTLDELKKHKPAEVWSGHHTTAGNMVVCEVLAREAFR